MSRKLLMKINGNRNGLFSRWLENFKGEPRIAWYPSAGEDFRDLLYLHQNYTKVNPAGIAEPALPDIFLHTDYFPWLRSTFLDSKVVNLDNQTLVTLKDIEELPRCNLPLDYGIVYFPKRSHVTGRVFFLDVEIDSKVLGKITAPVVYAFVENSAFCAKRALPQAASFSHIINVRYGGNLSGGGKSTGIWLLNVLRRLNCECFITDCHYQRQSDDDPTYTIYPELAGDENLPQLEQFRLVPSEGWSRHGDVSWNIVK